MIFRTNNTVKMENFSYENDNRMNGLIDNNLVRNNDDDDDEINDVNFKSIEENVDSHNKSLVIPSTELIIETRKKRRKKRDCKHCNKSREKVDDNDDDIKIINTNHDDKIINYSNDNTCIFNINNEDCQGIEMYWSRMMKINSIYADEKKTKENVSFISSPSDIHKLERNDSKTSRVLSDTPGSCLMKPPIVTVAILSLLTIGAFALYIVFEPERVLMIKEYFHAPKEMNFMNHTVVREENRKDIKLKSNESRELNGSSEVAVQVSLTMTNNPLFLKSMTSLQEQTETAFIHSTSDEFMRDERIDLSDDSVDVEERVTQINTTRQCDDCYDGEICIAGIDDEFAICRRIIDQNDPKGCGGICAQNEECQMDDDNIFRCIQDGNACLRNEWTCSNTLCIPLVKRCDGHMNCYDHSDEMDCPCDLTTNFHCGNGTSCLPLELQCDGRLDCWDASDESSCTLGCSPAHDFPCSNGECVLRSRYCDGLPDCTDASDEPSGCQGRCNKHEFTCRNGRCITRGLRCNGVDDCGDKSDESNCRQIKKASKS